MDTWLHLSDLIRIYIGATRTSEVNFNGGSVGGLYTRLTVILPKAGHNYKPIRFSSE